MTNKMIIFDLTNPMETSDNFFVKVKGFVEVSEEVEKGKIISSVEKSCRAYLRSVSLMEALDLVKPENAGKLVQGVNGYADSINKLEISTVDAVERSTMENVEVDIDPSLESQSQKQGFFSRVKGLFKR